MNHPPPLQARRWEPAMRLALEQAELAGDDVPVGAVVLDGEDRVIGRGHNRRESDHDPTAHAEVVALREAAENRGRWRLEGCTVVVTLEPCAMCAGAIALARLQRVVFGAFDPKAGAVGSVWDLLRDRRLNHRPEVLSGVLGEQCSDRLVEFFAAHRHRALDY